MFKVALITAASSLLALVLSVGAQPSQTDGSPLRLRMSGATLVRKGMPLIEALSEIGIRVRGGYVLFGIEIQLKDGKEPAVDVDIAANGTLGASLRYVMVQIPEYELEVLSEHLLSVRPVGAKTDGNNPLNVLVKEFKVANAHSGGILSRPKDFIPELAAWLEPNREKGCQTRYGPGLSGGGPQISLHLKNTTVRGILNAVSMKNAERAEGGAASLGWVYFFDPDPRLPVENRHRWKFHWSVYGK